MAAIGVSVSYSRTFTFAGGGEGGAADYTDGCRLAWRGRACLQTLHMQVEGVANMIICNLEQ